jgi:hypothetical protein
MDSKNLSLEQTPAYLLSHGANGSFTNLPTQSTMHSKVCYTVEQDDSMEEDEPYGPEKLFKPNQLVSFYPKIV